MKMKMKMKIVQLMKKQCYRTKNSEQNQAIDAIISLTFGDILIYIEMPYWPGVSVT